MVNLTENDLNFLRGLVRRKMRDQLNAAWHLKTKIERDGGDYDPALQRESMDFVEEMYEKLGGNPDDLLDMPKRPGPTA